jgi:AcrR family transcriptional regulator
MARTIDDTKIERIREAAISLVVRNGYGNASISEIARMAGVAEGYLYRHYKGKAELVEDLLYQNINLLADNLEHQLDDKQSIKDIFEQIIRTLFTLAEKNPEQIKFIYVLMNDYNFKIQEIQRERIFNLCSRVKAKGLLQKELREDISEEEIYLLGVSYPIQFINLRLKNFFNESKLGEEEIQRVMLICKNTINRNSL